MVQITWPDHPTTLDYSYEIMQLQSALEASNLITTFKWYRSPHRENYETIKNWLDDIQAENLTFGFACEPCKRLQGVGACAHRLDALTWLNNVEFFAYLVLRDADEDDEEDEDDERTEEEQNNYILRSMMCLLTVQFYQRLAHGWKHELNEDGTRSWRLYI